MVGLCASCACRLTRTCRVCHQDMDDARAENDTIRAILFGSHKYSICCCCRQEVYGYKDRNYRRRWLRWRKKQQKEGGST